MAVAVWIIIALLGAFALSFVQAAAVAWLVGIAIWLVAGFALHLIGLAGLKQKGKGKGKIRAVVGVPVVTSLIVPSSSLGDSAWGAEILRNFRSYIGRFWIVKPKAASLKSLVENLSRAA